MIPTGLCLIDEAGRVVEVNDAYCQSCGYTREELLGQPITLVVPPEERDAARTAWTQVLQGDRAQQSLAGLRRRHKNGAIIWTEGQAAPLIDEDGRRLLLFTVTNSAARKEAEVALATRTAQLEALRAVGVEITRELDLMRLLELILQRALALAGGDSGTVWLWDEAAQVLERRVAAGAAGQTPDRPRHLGEGVVGTVAQARCGLLINDYSSSSYALPEVVSQMGVAAVLSEPLLYRDRLIGVLTLDNRSAGRPFAPADQDLLRLFAAQAAIAIENARLFQEEQRRREQMEAVRLVSAEIARELDLDRLLDLILRRAIELAGAEAGVIMLWDEGTQTLFPRVRIGEFWATMPKRPISLGEGVVGHVAQTRQALIINDYRAWPGARPVALAHTAITASLGEPLLYRDILVGVIVLIHTGGEEIFTEHHGALLRLFAVQAAIAIENARLFTASQTELAARRQAEAALRDREEQLALAIAGSGVGLWDWRVQTGEATFNERWAEIVGYTLKELEPSSIETWKALVHAEDLAKSNELLRRHFAGEAPVYECEVRMQHKAGHWVWVLDRGTVTERAADGNPLRMTGTHLDITARKQLEEERLIRSKLESTGLLAGGIAHDFNNLLTVILGNLELLKLPGEDPARHLEAAIQATFAAHALTQQFITLAKGGKPVRQVTPLAGVIQEAASLALRGSPVGCDVSLLPDLWPVMGDRGQIGQVIRNLVLNAREALPTGGRITVRAENVVAPTPVVRVTLTDPGPGISPEILPRIFDPYFSTKQRGDQRGMGLGLTVARAIIEKHEGTLTVDTAVGRGTRVQITLPAVPPAATAPPADPSVQSGRGRLLLMDDELAVRTTAAALLRQLGYTVDLAEHGEQALTLYQSAQDRRVPFDGVILDLTVRGGMGGAQTLQALRRVSPTVKAIAASGYADDPVLLDPLRHGFLSALPKPFGLAALSEVVAKVLGS